MKWSSQRPTVKVLLLCSKIPKEDAEHEPSVKVKFEE